MEEKAIKIKIVRMDDDGRGIGYYQERIVFVPFVLLGEEVLVTIKNRKKNYDEAELVSVVTPSEYREVPKCPYFFQCGGCDLEHMVYEESIHYKADMLTNLFSRNHLFSKPISVVKNNFPYEYRNKISLKVQNGVIGFYEAKSHNFLEIKKCLLAKKSINDVMNDFKKYFFIDGELIIRTNENDEILLIITTEEEVFIETELLDHHKIVGIILNKKCIYGVPYFFERLNGVLYKISYDSFFQINHFMSTILFQKMKDIPANHVLDLYCGVGSLGLQVSNATSLCGIEVIPNAILNCIENAKLNHRIADYHLGNVETIIDKINKPYDLLLIDPPRLGITDKTIEVLKKIKAKTILYISCNPQTLVRDLKKLIDCYEILEVEGYDMFPNTKHVECVSLLVRKTLEK